MVCYSKLLIYKITRGNVMNIKFSGKKTKKIPNEKFLLEAITKYIESSNFPKKLVLKKHQK